MGAKERFPGVGVRVLVGSVSSCMIFRNKMEIFLSGGLKSKPCPMGSLIHLDSINIFWL